MPIVLTVSERSPDGGKGLARDTRVRWALEEVGRPYAVRPLSLAALKHPEHRTRNPFGQIPTLEDGEVTLFESSAIVLYLAERYGALLPAGQAERARAIMSMAAATNTVEPPILDLVAARFLEGDKPWAAARLPIVQERIRDRLRPLADALGAEPWLDGAFSVGDLVMISVLQRVRPSGLLAEFPTLLAYVERGEARPAYARAYAAQLATFEAGSDPHPATP